MLFASIFSHLPTFSTQPTEVAEPISASPNRDRGPRRRILYALLAFAFLLRILLALYTPNIHFPDEVFQTREPAHRLAYGPGIVSWEWRDGVRSWVLPGILAGVMRLTGWLAPGSYGYVTGVACFLAAISLLAVWFAFALGWRIGGKPAAIVAGFTAAVWYQLIYFGPKALTEVVAGHVLLPAIYFGTSRDIPSRHRLLIAGIFLGLTTSLRIQFAPVTVLCVVAFAWNEAFEDKLKLLLGFALPILAFGVVDAFTLSYPFQSFVRYFWINQVEGKSLRFGTQPWFWYFVSVAKTTLPLVLLACFAWKKTRCLLLVAAGLLILHSCVPHKELRFIYPVFPLLAAAAGIGLWTLVTSVGKVNRTEAVVVAIVYICAFSVAYGRETWDWVNRRGYLVTMQKLSIREDVCGLAVDTHWAESGGYTYLHHDIPLYLFEARNRLDLNPIPSSAYNYAIRYDSKDYASPLQLDRTYQKLFCRRSICVYRRPGECTVTSRYEANNVIRQLRK